MFKKIVLDNYKSFRHIELNLNKTDKDPLPYAFIYGENGSGKSNLVESMMFLKDTINTLISFNNFRTAIENESRNTKDQRRASELKMQTVPPRDITELSEIYAPTLPRLVENVKMIDSIDNVCMSYHFALEGRNGHYQMEFGQDGRISYEKLSFVVESRTQDIFELYTEERDKQKTTSASVTQKLSPSFFKNKTYEKTIQDHIQKYWGNHTFMSIMNDQFKINNKQYMEDSMGTKIKEVLDFFNGIIVSCTFIGQSWGTGVRGKIMTNLAKGTITMKEEPTLRVYEKALNSFFTRLYSDIKKAYYRTESNNGSLSYTLFFSKMIGGKRREIEISKESSGTFKLLNLFPAFFECSRGKTVFFDELDSGIHDILMKDVMAEMIGSFKGQFIATTHNTSLLEIMDPKCIFVIQSDPKGEKRIISISQVERTQRNHNNRNRYMNGTFEGIPIVGEIDFKGIVNTAEKGFEGVK